MQYIFSNNIKPVYWKYGIGFDYTENQRAIIEFDPRGHILQCIVISEDRTYSANTSLLYRVITVIESVIDACYISTVERLVLCNHCYRNDVPAFERTRFKYEDIVAKFVKGVKLFYCPNGFAPIYISDVAPDIAMRNIPLLSDKIFNQIKIGEGGFGVVYKGSITYNNGEREEVAIKEYKSLDLCTFKDFFHEVHIMRYVN